MCVKTRRLACVSVLACLLATAAAPASAQTPVAAPAALMVLPNGVQAANGAMAVEVTALTDSILRVRVARGGNYPEDASWAVPAAVRAERTAVQPAADGFTTNALAVRLDPATLRLTVTDRAGKLIVADGPEPVHLDGTGFTLRKALPIDEHIFGMGDKTGALDRRETTLTNWNTDRFTPAADPIYKSIPFYIGVGGEGGSYGLFLDNSWRSTFDFGHREDGVISFGSVDGPIDYYIIAGPSMADVVRRYTDLTGKAPMPPKWALGYQQSRWSYASDAEVRALAARFRKERFPIDVIWLDIDYQDQNRPFTVDAKTFPDMPKLVGDMGKDGIKLVAITDLHVAYLPNQGYAPYDSGAAGDHFVKQADGSLFVAPVWPGPSVFPDFTRTSTRAWWGGLYKDFIADGFAGFWNDMNEPAVFETLTKTMPLDNLHRIDGDGFAPRTASHAEIHNVYGMENSRATFEGMERLRPNVRPFVMTRASFAGGQRYAVTWTGDNSSTWDHLRLSVQQLTSLGLSGFAYSGADVGGFIGGASPELLTRWIEVGAFTPVFRDHSMKDAPRAEPWVDGPAQLAIRRHYVEERYRLMPYLYALADLNHRTGDPLMRPLYYDYPETLKVDCDRSMTFALGRDLIVAGPGKPESPAAQEICLPPNGKFFDYWTGLAVAPGKIFEKPKLDRLPVYVRAGAIIPRQPLVQSTAEIPPGPLSLDIYPGEDCAGTLYADDGESVTGPFLRQQLTCTVAADSITLHFAAREGSLTPWWKSIAVTVHDWQGAGHIAGIDKPAATTANTRARTVAFTIPDQLGAADIRIEHR